MRLRGLRCVEALSTSGATPLSDSSFHAAPVANDDADAAGFMIQCEMCKAWQHGPCMGFASENDIPQGDYYCEQCKPEDHVELIKCVLSLIRDSPLHPILLL